MSLFDNRRAKVSLSLIIIGGFVLCLLVTLGLVVRAAVHNVTTSRLKYEYPEGYENDPDMMWCYNKQDGQGKFSDEYYLWNLTNLNEVLQGANSVYELAGPYSYANWTCDFDWDKDGDLLRYRTLSNGFHFLPGQSAGSQNDLITNVNPGYLGLLKAAGSESGIIALMSGGALKLIITTLQNPNTIAQIQATSRPTVLSIMNNQLLPAFAAGVSVGTMNTILTVAFPSGVDDNTKHNVMFNNPNSIFPVVQLGGTFRGYANYINATYGVVPPPLSNDTMNQLIAVWSVNGTGVGLVNFVQTAQANITVIVVTYRVDPATANFLLAYAGNYMMNAQSINLQYVQSQMYAQWANGTRPQINLGGGLKGWEIGIPVPSEFSAPIVAKLFNVNFAYSLTNQTVGANFWIGVMQGNVTISVVRALVDPSITDLQYNLLRGWLYNYTTTLVPPLLLKQFGLTNWNDFAYAQWGSLVLGQSVGPLQNLSYYPEVAAFDPTPYGLPPSCVRFNVTEAKALLNGSNPLMNPAQTAYFLTFAKAKNYAYTKALYNLDKNKTDCLYLYLTLEISQKAVVPGLTNYVNSGSGLFVTRTVQQWLFTAQDPLLQVLGQNPKVGMAANNTSTEETAEYNYVRMYTGKNDLYASLQPGDFGQVVHGFWAEDIPVMGYNGSQFMPFDYVKKVSNENTMKLWHRTVMRPIGLKYYGMTKWQGLDLAYLAINPSELASMYANPANAKYFSQYGGLINESSFITNNGLPVFLSLPGFNLADASVSENLTLIDHIFEPLPEDPSENLSRHRYQTFVLVEPYLGASLWGNIPIQANFKYGPTDIFFTGVKPNFAPIFWKAIGDIASQDQVDHLKNTLYRARKVSKALLGVGAGLGGLLIIFGAVGLVIYRNKYMHTNADDRSQNAKL